MKVHLLRSSEVEKAFVHQVLSILSAFPGPAEFILEDSKLRWQDDELEKLDWEDEDYYFKADIQFSMAEPMLAMESEEVFTWDDVFSKTADYRSIEQIPEDELVVILTAHANEHNWFSAGDPSGSMNFFVHTGMWDRFLDSDPRFPVVYQLISLTLKMAMFGSYSRFVKNAHSEPRGCINDFCQDKRDIVMKMRTGDICQSCVDQIISNNVDPALVSQVTNVIDSIRSPMLFRERYKMTRQPSRLEIRGPNYRFYLSDLADLKVPLTPMERAVYLLVLNHPEGISISHFPDHQKELKRYYSSTSVEGSVAVINDRVIAITENHESLLSQILTRIKRKYIDLVGTEMAQAYIIKGGSGEKRRIGLDRGLVVRVE